MTDLKLTDDDVIKALEVCVNNDSCKECPINPNHGNYGYCTNLALTHALALINRQKAESDLYKRLNEELEDELASTYDKLETAKAEAKNMQAAIEKLRMDRYQLLPDGRVELIPRTDINAIKAEAIAEFAERLKANMSNIARMEYGGRIYYCVGYDLIDNLVKEMTEGNNESKST